MLFIGIAGLQELIGYWAGAIKNVKRQTVEQQKQVLGLPMVAGERKIVCENAKSGTNGVQYLHSIETSKRDNKN